MSPFYPRLPEPQYTDPLTAGVTGLGMGLAVGNRALQSQMYGEALAAEREKRQALKEYGETGDVSKLMTVAPEVGVRLQEAKAHQQKAMMDAVKPALELTYMLAPSATPENYDALANSITSSFPIMKGLLPPKYDKAAIDNFISQYESFLRKGKETRPSGTKWFRGPGGQFRTFSDAETPPPGWTPYEKPIQEREYPIVDESGKVTGKVTSTGRPVVQHPKTGFNFEQSYQEALRTDPTLTRTQHRINLIKQETAAREGSKAEKPLTPKQKADLEKTKAKTQLIKKLTGESEAGEPPFPAADNKGKFATSPDGTQWKSDGSKWVRYTGE